MAEDNTLGVLAHVLGIFTSFVGPLIIYLVAKDKKGVNFENAKSALNFQISLIIYYIISAVLIIVLIGILLLIALSIFSLIVMIIGAVKASEGKVYQYPLCIRFIK